jgi:hypothetical protein
VGSHLRQRKSELGLGFVFSSTRRYRHHANDDRPSIPSMVAAVVSIIETL